MSKDDYGTGGIRRLKSGRFQARFHVNGKREPIGVFDTEEAAEKALAAEIVARSRLTFERGVSFADFGRSVHKAYWKAAREHGRDVDHSAERNDLSRWDFWITRSWEHAKLPPEAMDRTHFEHLYTHILTTPGDRGTPPKNRTMSNIWVLVRRVADAALTTRPPIWTTDHLYKLEAPERDGEHVEGANPLTTKEMHLVLKCKEYEPHQTCAHGLKFYSGLRAGEMAALLKTDFHSVWNDHCDCHDLEEDDRLLPHVMVSKSWRNPTTKNKNNEKRRVWICEFGVPILTAWIQYVENLPSRSKRYKKNSPYFWGRLYARGYDWGWADKYDKKRGTLYPGCKTKAGIARHVTEHQLRDTYASHLISGTFGRRWSAEEVARQLDHSSTYVTERYGKLLDRSMAQAIRETPGLSANQRPPTQNTQPFAPVIQLPVAFRAPALSEDRAHLASTILASYEAAKGGSDTAADDIESTALQLAGTILDAEDVKLAQRVLAKDRMLLMHGVELARMLILKADTQTSTNKAPAEVVQMVRSKGSKGRFTGGPDDRRWTGGGTPHLENRPDWKRDKGDKSDR